MGKLRNKTGDKGSTIDVKKDFHTKKSDDFYKYHYHNEKAKEPISNWKELRDFYYETFPNDKASKWLFRGDVAVCDQKRSMKEAFKTSLDKAFEEFPPVRSQYRNMIEKAIMRAFRRRAHLFTDDKSNAQNQLEALALSRHHGAPARILDWMYSFFPAVYLAMNREYDRNDKHTTYTVWALNNRWIRCVSQSIEEDFLRDKDYLLYHFRYVEKRTKQSKRETKKYSEIRRELKYHRQYDNNQFQNYVITHLVHQNSRSLIYAASPYHFNERLAAQKGTLLFSGTVDKTWGENLQDVIIDFLQKRPDKKNGDEIEGPILWEIPFRLLRDERKQFIRGLDEMNINQATLFPDLDGFAESLRTRIAHPESLGIPVQ